MERSAIRERQINSLMFAPHFTTLHAGYACFGQGLTEATPLHVFIIVQIGAQQVGLLADRVSDIVSVERATIKPVPEVDGTRGLGFLSGLATVDNATVGLIALDSILAVDAGAAEHDMPASELLSA